MSTLVESLAGSLLGTFCLAILLYGSATAQIYSYWLQYPGDSKKHRGTVGAVWFIDTIHTAFCLVVIYHYIIVDYGNIRLIENMIWSVAATIITEVMLSAIVQSFYVRQVWVFSQRNVLLCAVISVMLFLRIALGLATVGLIFHFATFAQFSTSIGPLFTLTCGLSLAAAVDLIVAIALIYYRLKTPRRACEKLHPVELIQSYMINTGGLTVLVSLAIVFTFSFLKGNLVFAGLVEVQAKLYANSFIATMSERAAVRTAMKEAEDMERAGQRTAGHARNRPSRNVALYLQDSMLTGEAMLASGNQDNDSTALSVSNVNREDAEADRKTPILLTTTNGDGIDTHSDVKTELFP